MPYARRPMRQFITLRFWMSLLAVVALLRCGLRRHARRPDSDNVIAASAGPVTRHVDFVVAGVLDHRRPRLRDGPRQDQRRAAADHRRRRARWSSSRTRPARSAAASSPRSAQCVVVADLLGDAVLWFAHRAVRAAAEHHPAGHRQARRPEPVVELTNGWVLHRAASRRPRLRRRRPLAHRVRPSLRARRARRRSASTASRSSRRPAPRRPRRRRRPPSSPATDRPEPSDHASPRRPATTADPVPSPQRAARLRARATPGSADALSGGGGGRPRRWPGRRRH